MTAFSSRLKQLLLLALVLNALVLGMQVYASLRTVSVYRDSLLELGDTLMRSFSGGHRYFMRRMTFSAEDAERYFKDFFQATTVKNFVLYDEQGKVLQALHPGEAPEDRPVVNGRTVLETADEVLFYAPYQAPRMGMMAGRSSPPMYMALTLDKGALNDLKRKTWLYVGIVLVVQALLVLVYLHLLRFIRHHLQTQEKLDAAERHAELGRFAGVLAHEIKNPLSALRGLLHFALQKEQDDSLREVQEKSLEEVDRLNRIADDFLSYGKEAVLERSEVDLLSLLQRAQSLVHYELDSKGQQCAVSGDSFIVSADRDKMLQVVVNLLLNAAQGAPDGGRIDLVLDARRRRLVMSNPVAEPVTATAEQLFAPFYSTRSRGSGLGLAIARKILELHGFSLVLEATSPFTLILGFDHESR